MEGEKRRLRAWRSAIDCLPFGHPLAGSDFAINYATTQIQGSTISNNQAWSGAGIDNEDGSLTLSSTSSYKTVVSGNGTRGITSTAGGIAQGLLGLSGPNAGGMITVNPAVTISSNHAAYGGGILNAFGSLSMTGDTMKSNTASDGNGFGEGGAILNNGNAAISNTQIQSNSAASLHGGGGLYNDAQGGVTLSNDGLKSNTPDNWYCVNGTASGCPSTEG